MTGRRRASQPDGLRSPQGDPCPSCPYRRDAPAGQLDAATARQMAAYDHRSRYDQPQQVLACRERPGQVCGGWAACHDGYSLWALGAAGITAGMSDGAVERTLRYRTTVRLWDSGTQAAAHGTSQLDSGN